MSSYHNFDIDWNSNVTLLLGDQQMETVLLIDDHFTRKRNTPSSPYLQSVYSTFIRHYSLVYWASNTVCCDCKKNLVTCLSGRNFCFKYKGLFILPFLLSFSPLVPSICWIVFTSLQLNLWFASHFNYIRFACGEKYELKPDSSLLLFLLYLTNNNRLQLVISAGKTQSFGCSSLTFLLHSFLNLWIGNVSLDGGIWIVIWHLKAEMLKCHQYIYKTLTFIYVWLFSYSCCWVFFYTCFYTYRLIEKLKTNKKIK